MVNLLKIFNKRKMELEQLKQENEGLKAQIVGVSFNLHQADQQVVALQKELESWESFDADMTRADMQIRRLERRMSV